MPVQIPNVQRMAPQEDPSVGRIDYKTPNIAGVQAQQSGQAEKLADTSVNYFQREQEYAADTAGTAAAVQYHQFLENGLEGPDGAKRVKGDPAPAYAKFDDDSKKYKDNVLSDESVPASTKAVIAAKLNDVDKKFYDRRTTAFGAQSSNYQTSVTNDAVTLTKNDMMDSTAHLDVTDPNTTVPFEKNLADIEDLRVKQGLKNGTVTQDKDGSYILNPSMKLQIAKDKSDGITKAINNLNASGDADGAKFLTDKYGYLLDAVNKPKVEEKTKKAFEDQQANNEFAAVRNLTNDQALNKLKQIDDPKIQDQAMKLYDSYTRRMNNADARQSKDNYNAIGQVILSRQKSGSPFTDSTEMLNDPTIKRLLDNVKDPKQTTALMHMVDQPKDSDPDVKATYQNVLFGNDPDGRTLKNMKPEDFNLLISGLSKQDRARANTQYEKENNPSMAEEVRTTKNMGSNMVKQLQAVGFVKKDQYGKYSNNDQIKITNAGNELTDAIDKAGPMSVKEQNDFVRKFAADKIKGQTFSPPEQIVPKFNPPKNAPAAPSPISGLKAPPATATGAQLNLQAAQQWSAANGGKTPNLSDPNIVADIYKRVQALKNPPKGN